MPNPKKEAAYAVRMDRVVQYIWQHLDKPLPLDRLAEVACFSPYHFHRIYRLTTGETTAQTVRRLRLHRAAAELTDDARTMEQVATHAGYGSVEAFSRAFSSAYGLPPSSYRAEREMSIGQFTPEEVACRYEVSIVEHPALHLLGIPHEGAYLNIGQAFERLYAWAFPAGLVTADSRSLGVYYTDESAVPSAQLRSFAGIGVDVPPSTVPDWIEAVSIPGGLSAKLIHKGPYTDLSDAYRYLYGPWLRQSGYDPAHFPCFEEYLNNPREVAPNQLLTAIYLPLKPVQAAEDDEMPWQPSCHLLVQDIE